MKIAMTTVLLACLSVGVPAQEITDTVRDIPTDTAATEDASVQYHPEYKALLEDLKRLEMDLRGADDESAAWARQRYDAAAARLNAYLASGRPTILAVSESPSHSMESANSTANVLSTVRPGSQGTGGNRRTTVPECAASFDFYERIESEGWESTGAKTVDVDSGAYALQWQNDSFSVQQSVTVVSDMMTGGWEKNSTSITGQLSATGDRLQTITFELVRLNETKETGLITDGYRVTLVDLPLRQVTQAGVFDVYEFELRGGNAIQPHVQNFTRISDSGDTTGMLRLNVSGDEPVLLDSRREPRIYVKVMKSKL